MKKKIFIVVMALGLVMAVTGCSAGTASSKGESKAKANEAAEHVIDSDSHNEIELPEVETTEESHGGYIGADGKWEGTPLEDIQKEMGFDFIYHQEFEENGKKYTFSEIGYEPGHVVNFTYQAEDGSELFYRVTATAAEEPDYVYVDKTKLLETVKDTHDFTLYGEGTKVTTVKWNDDEHNYYLYFPVAVERTEALLMTKHFVREGFLG